MLAKRTSKLLFSTAIFLLVVAITHETTGNKIKEIIMKKLTIVSILLLAVTMNIYAQEKDFPKLKGPFLGQKPPVKEPIIFAVQLLAQMGKRFTLKSGPKMITRPKLVTLR